MSKLDFKFLWPILSILATLLLLNAFVPLTTQAHPRIGITPTETPSSPTDTPPPLPPRETPTPLPPTDTPSPPDDGDDDDDDDNDIPPPPSITLEFVLNCNLICPPATGVTQISIPVQIVHADSGWTINTTLSNAGGTQLTVPQAGEWQIISTGPPQISDGTLIGDVPPSTLLGTVQTGSGLQLVNCPFSCAEAGLPPPERLPETGQQNTVSLLIILSGLGLIVLGISVIQRQRSRGQ